MIRKHGIDAINKVDKDVSFTVYNIKFQFELTINNIADKIESLVFEKQPEIKIYISEL